MDCYTCRRNERIEQLPVRELIGLDDHWRVAHAFDAALPGWLVLLPRRHVLSIADLTDAEAAVLGTWQVRLARALGVVTGCAKTYVMQFSEQEGFAHLHFHVVPRMPGLPAEHRGPRIFAYLGGSPAENLDEVAAALRDALA
ncbi:hypothetical protein Asi03nite_04280 [Actinoplanes siamensis]|uniref:HIT domain-containing protein n=1 Tax=Actinoplanes siamensis TaxID=1223317 RepID=A0A919KC49_9ACTN|nr:hypothetical protein Asi03nite_04280 [Actinoplanes siamensis]